MSHQDYRPTPAEIRRACAEIRKRWEPGERRRRMYKPREPIVQHWMPMVVTDLLNQDGESFFTVQR